jgi:single-strand DNA-binding protein
MNINRCELSGNVTRDGELKATQGGTSVLVFGLAFNDRKRDEAGNWVDVPNFIDVVIYGRMAESLAPYIVKGQKLFVAGKLHYSTWTKDGGKRTKLELVAQDIDIAGGRRQGAQATQAPQDAPTYSVPQAPPIELYDEDIPF